MIVQSKEARNANPFCYAGCSRWLPSRCRSGRRSELSSLQTPDSSSLVHGSANPRRDRTDLIRRKPRAEHTLMAVVQVTERTASRASSALRLIRDSGLTGRIFFSACPSCCSHPSGDLHSWNGFASRNSSSPSPSKSSCSTLAARWKSVVSQTTAPSRMTTVRLASRAIRWL